jgi:choice-of-anchor C domain-containing protein
MEKMMIKTLVLAAVVATAGFGAANAATIVNGSFEADANIAVDPFKTLAGGDSTSITGWTVGGDSVDWIGSYWEASEGNRSVDLNGGGQGSLSTVISNLITGMKYVISFDLSGNPDGAPDLKTVDVSVSDGSQTQAASSTYDIVSNGTTRPSPMGWLTQTFTFTALADQMRLTFASGDRGFYGAAIDNVTISAVPLPAAAPLLLAGLGGLAALRRRRKA